MGQFWTIEKITPISELLSLTKLYFEGFDFECQGQHGGDDNDVNDADDEDEDDDDEEELTGLATNLIKFNLWKRQNAAYLATLHDPE